MSTKGPEKPKKYLVQCSGFICCCLVIILRLCHPCLLWSHCTFNGIVCTSDVQPEGCPTGKHTAALQLFKLEQDVPLKRPADPGRGRRREKWWWWWRCWWCHGIMLWIPQSLTPPPCVSRLTPRLALSLCFPSPMPHLPTGHAARATPPLVPPPSAAPSNPSAPPSTPAALNTLLLCHAFSWLEGLHTCIKAERRLSQSVSIYLTSCSLPLLSVSLAYQSLVHCPWPILIIRLLFST